LIFREAINRAYKSKTICRYNQVDFNGSNYSSEIFLFIDNRWKSNIQKDDFIEVNFLLPLL
jgi:hypothetical protein